MFDDSDCSDDDEFDDGFHETGLESKKPSAVVEVGAKHLQQLREILDLDAFQRKKEAKIRKRKARKAKKKAETGGGMIETLASKRLGLPPAEIVSYTDYRKLKNPKTNSRPNVDLIQNLSKETRPRTEPGGKEISMQQARFEVFKLGVSAMDKNAQEDAQTALAIRLGAKPAKEKGLPYMELKEKREREKEEEKVKIEERENAMAGVRKKSKTSQDKTKKNKTKPKKSSSGMKIGTFDGGMLKLSSKELSRLKGK